MEFKGLYTALLTPFWKGGKNIDFCAYERLVKRQIDAGVQGIVPCGTTGESPTLDHEEHQELIARSVAFAQGKIQVIAGTGSNSTKEAIELTEAACRAGVQGVMLVSPYYNKPSQHGLKEHFAAIADHSSAPVMLYNIQARTGVNIEVETFQSLAEHERIRAVKEASGDIFQMIRLKKYCGDRLSLLCGDDTIVPAFMGLGGDGLVSVASNLYPARMKAMMDLYLQENFSQGNSIFHELFDLIHALFWDTNPIALKAAASLQKLCEESLRLPLIPLDRVLYKELAALLEGLGREL